MAAPALSVTSEVPGQAQRHRCQNKHFLAYDMYSLKGVEFTWILLFLELFFNLLFSLIILLNYLFSFFSFFPKSAATVVKACEMHLSHKIPYTGPSRSFWSNQLSFKVKFLHPENSTRNITKCCNSMIQLIKQKVVVQVLKGFNSQLEYKGTYQISEV